MAQLNISKVYYVTDIYCDKSVNEHWLFKPHFAGQTDKTEHVGCISVENGNVVWKNFRGGRIAPNHELVEFREATPEETKIYEDSLEAHLHNQY